MIAEVENVLLEEMKEDDYRELQDIGTFKEAEDQSMGFDEETGELDPDAGMLFPQPIQN